MSKVKEAISTARQQEIYEAVQSTDSYTEAAELVGTSRQNVGQVMRHLIKKAAGGQAPEQELNRPCAPGMATKRVSTAKKIQFEDGSEGYQWHIQEPDKVAMKRAAEEFVAGLSEGIKGKAPKVAPPKTTVEDTMVSYNIGDHHFGMYAWGEETGDDNYDIQASAALLDGAVSRLTSSAPDAQVGLLCNLGDFLHANDSTSQTQQSKHLLDTDGRFGLVARQAGLLIRQLILRMLEKHEEVWVLNARGNHDPDAALWLNNVIEAFFHDEPRVKVLPNYSKFVWFQWGTTLVVTHHGDKMKPRQMYEAITRNLRREWGEADHVYGWVGHIHHKQAEELGGMTIESWNVLAPPDAWHASAGYGASRSMSAVVLHKKHGEICRLKVPVISNGGG